jgi:site-specific DNA recombinase
MAGQVRVQGRYQGGRPPYGYRLVDAGPHPNRAHAAWGRRAHRLEPDPDTASIVRWMFTQRLAGHSMARITRALNDMQVPCPSAADPQRNTHRAAAGWSLTTVRAILANPRYTGREVWNRQPTNQELIDPGNTGLGHQAVQRWSLPGDWVISDRPVHVALVSEADFVAVQSIRTARGSADPGRRYQLAGLLRCGLCGRRLESCWANDRVAYRCRHGHTSATRPDPDRPKNLYVREDHLLAHLPAVFLLLNRGSAGAVPTEGASPSPAEVISYLRAQHVELVYGPHGRTLRADVPDAVRVRVDRRAS